MIPKKLKLNSINEIKKNKENTEKVLPMSLKTHLPKSEYDSNGKPILNIEVDDLNLNDSALKMLKRGVFE